VSRTEGGRHAERGHTLKVIAADAPDWEDMLKDNQSLA
jgi:hypothetical protein